MQTLDQPYRSHYTRKVELKLYTHRNCNLVCMHIYTQKHEYIRIGTRVYVSTYKYAHRDTHV